MRCAPLIALVISACSDTIPVPTTVDIPGMPNPEVALQLSLRHIDTEMAELGRLLPASARLLRPLVPDDLQRIVSFSFNGPLDEGVAKLASSVGYTFYTSGPAAEQPLTVAVDLASVSVYRVFQVLGEEAGPRASVQLDPQHHQVQVIHHV
jgi:defect-in-organelle-trafficking protein DotD